MTSGKPSPEFTIRFEIEIGDYALSPSERAGHVWLTCKGEGGEFEVAKLERALAAFFAENF